MVFPCRTIFDPNSSFVVPICYIIQILTSFFYHGAKHPTLIWMNTHPTRVGHNITVCMWLGCIEWWFTCGVVVLYNVMMVCMLVYSWYGIICAVHGMTYFMLNLVDNYIYILQYSIMYSCLII